MILLPPWINMIIYLTLSLNLLSLKCLVQASKQGSIGSKYCEKRTYEIITENREKLVEIAIARAHHEGLEHVLVTHIKEVEGDTGTNPR